jgi:hypothetical protein
VVDLPFVSGDGGNFEPDVFIVVLFDQGDELAPVSAGLDDIAPRLSAVDCFNDSYAVLVNIFYWGIGLKELKELNIALSVMIYSPLS